MIFFTHQLFEIKLGVCLRLDFLEANTEMGTIGKKWFFSENSQCSGEGVGKYYRKVLSFQGYCNKIPYTGWYKQQECILSVLKRRHLRTKCQLGWFLLRALKKNLFHVSLSFWLFVGNLWFSLACRYITPSLSPHAVLPVCVSVPKFSLLIKTLAILDLGPHQWPHFNLLPSVTNLFKNKVMFRGNEDLDFNIVFFDGHNTTHKAVGG